jgi:hypothetical protein
MPDIKQGRLIANEPEFWLDFINIPTVVLSDTSLTPREMLLFGLIQAMDDPIQGCFASNDYLSLILNISTTSISISISKLKENHYILDNNSNNQRRVLKVNPRYLEFHQENTIQLVEKINHFKQYQKEKNLSAFKKTQKQLLRKLKHSIKEEYKSDGNSGKEKDSELPLNDSENHAGSKSVGLGFRRKKFPKTKTSESKSKQPAKRKNKYVEYFNTLVHINKHQLGSKQYNLAAMKCKNLLNGTFHKFINIDSEFAAKHNITDKIIKHKFTTTEIKETMKGLETFFKEGHWGYGKFKNRGLNNLLYNPYGGNDPKKGTSLFLMVYANPKILEPITTKVVKDLFKNEINILLPCIKLTNGNGDLTDKEKIILTANLKAIKKFHEEILKNPYQKVVFRYRKFTNLLEEFVEFISYQDWLSDKINGCPVVDVKTINVNSGIWSRFIKDCEEDLDIKLINPE